ncbi:hypothetical protein O3G_MSEX012613 [Manduca sexta]|uniref:Uncharacterized protein n=1 Tax=Manduca sexta TaxID=7130 RepID=A0A921ZP95_MANSE|nr:hypothetical protein O3G_MSEX012613 [Manduca sexta]
MLSTRIATDIDKFSWKQYGNVSDEQLYSQLCDGAERLLQKRSLQLSVPGYLFKLESKGNGTLNVDMLQNADKEIEAGRGSKKKFTKMFYKIVPFLVLPGLLMSAVLPFILPALKMMTIGAGMLNNMALTGAVFTLLRNNAFNDKYEHKVLYVNAGYKNEKHAPLHFTEGHPTNVQYDIAYAKSHKDERHENNEYSIDENVETIEEVPINPNWINKYSGNKYYKVIEHKVEQKIG